MPSPSLSFATHHHASQDNAGRAFEFMVEDIDKQREAQGLPTMEEAWKGG